MTQLDEVIVGALYRVYSKVKYSNANEVRFYTRKDSGIYEVLPKGSLVVLVALGEDYNFVLSQQYGIGELEVQMRYERVKIC